jgi:hypothetical protein
MYIYIHIFIGFTKPNKFIGFEAIHATKPYKFACYEDCRQNIYTVGGRFGVPRFWGGLGPGMESHLTPLGIVLPGNVSYVDSQKPMSVRAPRSAPPSCLPGRPGELILSTI